MIIGRSNLPNGSKTPRNIRAEGVRVLEYKRYIEEHRNISSTTKILTQGKHKLPRLILETFRYNNRNTMQYCQGRIIIEILLYYLKGY